jgi:hypothetical protein
MHHDSISKRPLCHHAIPAAMALATFLAPVLAQQPFQLPTALGPAATGLGTISAPLQAVGSQALARRTSTTTDEIGMLAIGNSLVFSSFASRPIAQAIPDPQMERGVSLPTRIFFTETVGATRVLRAATAGSVTTLATLPAGNWRLRAVATTNTRFILQDITTNVLRRVDTAPTPLQVQLGTVAGATSVAISPNGQTLAAMVPAGGPPLNNNVVTLSALSNSGNTTHLTASIVGSPVWLDNRFLCVVQTGAPSSRLMRIDTSAPGTVAALTMAPVNVDAGVPLTVSDDHEWLSFATQQSIAGNVERVPALMRTANAATTPNGVAGPGGAYIELGDYRQLGPVASYTNWNNLDRIVVGIVPGTPSTSSVRALWRGRRAFGAPVELFRGDVWDDITVPAFGQNGTTLNVQTVPPPFATFASVQISFSRPPAPISLAGLVDNHQLIDNPVTLFTVAATQGVPLSIPITLPALSGLPPINLLFQAAWFTLSSPRPHLSHISELPVF